jgi:chromosome segregation ATPase
MPRVAVKTKNKAGKPYGCDRCADEIVAGQRYYEWSFRYGGTHRQHESHGHPKPSQLTQSKMSGAYAAIEEVEQAISKAENASDIAAALNDAAQEISGVKDEYQESLDAMPDSLRDSQAETQEKIDALEEFENTLTDAASEIESEEPDEDEDETPEQNIEDLRQRALDALGEFSF